MTGIDDPYEAPLAPDLVVAPGDPDPVAAVLTALRAEP